MNNNQIQNIINTVLANPSMRNNPIIGVIQNGNSQQGQQVAQNICNTLGLTYEEGVQRALQFFNLK